MADAKISLVVAVARNGVIGEGNRLPWRLPSELKRFRDLTMGHPLIMGRRTFEGIGKPLEGRDNIVITRGEIIDHAEVHTVNSIEEAVALARRLAATRKVDEIMVIGGAQIYAQTLALADRIYFTQVHMEADGDALFPQLDREKWRETAREKVKAGPEDHADFTLMTLERAA